MPFLADLEAGLLGDTGMVDPSLVPDSSLARGGLLGPDVQPRWSLDNPVGTDTTAPYAAQSVGEQRGPFDEIVDPSEGRWPGRPALRSEMDRMREGSIGLFGDLAMIAGGEAPTASADKSVVLPAMRRRPTGPRSAAVRRGAIPDVPEGPHPEPPPPEPEAPQPETPPAGPADTVADIGGGTRGMMAVPSLRSMTPAEASVAAASEPHLIPKAGGGYIGAPADVQTPEDILRMRERLDASIAAGAEGRHWYRDARNFISDVTGTPRFDPNTGFGSTGFGSNSGAVATDARRMAEGLAVFSPQANPDTNLQFFLQAHNAFTRGEPLPLVRNTQQATKFNEGMAAKEEAAAAGRPEPDIRQGPKTGPYAWHLSPDRPYGTTGVNDIWHARSFGYTNPDGSEFDGSPTAQQHMFMDYETQLAIDRANANATGGFTDWDAATIQAAPWVANKEIGLAKQYPKWTPEKVHEEALKTYPDFATGVSGYMTHEQVPGKSTGLYDLLPADQRDAFSNASTWAHPTTGRDMLTGNFFLQPPMKPSTGTYLNSAGQFEMNPAQTAKPMLDFVAGSNPRTTSAGTQAALTGATSARTLIDAQEGNAWHHIDTRDAVRVSDANSMRLTGVRPTADQLEQLNRVAEHHGFFLSDTGDGISLLNAGRPLKDTPPGALPSPVDGRELKARLAGGLQEGLEQTIPGVTVKAGRPQGDYTDLSNELALSVKGEGRATDKVLADLDNMKRQAPGMYDRLMNNPRVASKARANLQRLTPEMRELRPDYVHMLQIVSDGKLKALLEHVTNYGSAGLPVVLGALAASSHKGGDS